MSTPEAEKIQARLRQIDEYERKGLMRAEEAARTRAALQRRLLAVLMPDTPAPRVGWRVRLWAMVAMAVLVGSVSAYLASGHAGLRRQSEEMLDLGKVVAAQDEAARRERLARLRAGVSIAPDANGVFPQFPASGATAASGPAATATAAAAPAAGKSADDGVAPLLSGRVTLAPALKARVRDDDALFVTVRLPDDPTGLPLAQLRVDAVALPLDFDIGARALLGDATRFMQARSVVVTARISRSGAGAPRAGDLVGTSVPVPPWSGQVRVVVDRVVAGP